MSMLRGIDRAHDRDLGPSGHAYSGHHFLALGDLPTPVDIKRAEDRRIDAERQRQNREAVNARKPRCDALMPTWGERCARPAGHGTRHRSVLWDRHGNFGRVDEPRDGQVLDNGGVQSTTTEDRP